MTPIYKSQDGAREAHALWLDDVLEALSLDRASMVGVSLGGWLALDYAARRPERAESLALLCPSGVGRQLFGQVILEPTPDAPPAIRKFIDHPRMEELPIFSDDALKRLTMPVKAIPGGNDVLLDSAGTKRRLERNVAHADIRYLPEAGHVIRGQTFPILEFLRGARSTAAVAQTS